MVLIPRPGPDGPRTGLWATRLVWATPRADFTVLSDELWSTITAIFPWVNNFASSSYLQHRFWYYCQIFKTSGLFLLNAGVFPFSLFGMLWDTCISKYMHKDLNLEVLSTEKVSNKFSVSWHITPAYLNDNLCRIWDEIPTTILQR